MALILALVAWFTYLNFDGNLTDEGREINEVITGIQLSQTYVEQVFFDSINLAVNESNDLDADFRQNFIQTANERNLNLSQAGNFFGKIRNGDFTLSNEGESYQIKIEGVFVSYENGWHKARQDFDLTAKFNESGIISEDL